MADSSCSERSGPTSVDTPDDSFPDEDDANCTGGEENVQKTCPKSGGDARRGVPTTREHGTSDNERQRATHERQPTSDSGATTKIQRATVSLLEVLKKKKVNFFSKKIEILVSLGKHFPRVSVPNSAWKMGCRSCVARLSLVCRSSVARVARARLCASTHFGSRLGLLFSR